MRERRGKPSKLQSASSANSTSPLLIQGATRLKRRNGRAARGARGLAGARQPRSNRPHGQASQTSDRRGPSVPRSQRLCAVLRESLYTGPWRGDVSRANFVERRPFDDRASERRQRRDRLQNDLGRGPILASVAAGTTVCPPHFRDNPAAPSSLTVRSPPLPSRKAR